MSAVKFSSSRLLWTFFKITNQFLLQVKRWKVCEGGVTGLNKNWGEDATLSCRQRLWLKTFSMNAATWLDGVLTSNEEQKTAQKTFLAGVCRAKSHVKYCCARHGGGHMGLMSPLAPIAILS